MISRSGSLGTLVCLDLVRAGYGQSAFIGIGGDPMIGTTTRDALQALDEDERTRAVVLVGEIGGSWRRQAAEYAAGMQKPIVAFIAGAASPPGKRMGHAGAIVAGGRGRLSSETKRVGEGGDRGRGYAEPDWPGAGGARAERQPPSRRPHVTGSADEQKPRRRTTSKADNEANRDKAPIMGPDRRDCRMSK